MISFKLTIDILFDSALFVNAIILLPQLIKILKVKDTSNFSLIAYIGFSFVQLAVFFHALFQHDNWLMIGTLPNLIIITLITILIPKYRKI